MEEEVTLKERAMYIDSLSSQISHGEFNLSRVPEQLRKILINSYWKEFITKQGKHVVYEDFEEFVETPPLEGLGTTLDFIKSIIKDDKETARWLSMVLRKSKGRQQITQEYLEKLATNRVNHPICCEESTQLQLPLDNEKQERYGKLLLRLQKDYLELYNKVVAGELSVYTAAVQACIYPPRIAINLKDPGSAAQTILRNSSEEYVTDLLEYLREGLTDG